MSEVDTDAIEVGIGVGQRLSRVVEGLDEIERTVDTLRLRNAEWEGSFPAKLQALFSSVRLSGVSSELESIMKGGADSIQSKIEKKLNYLMKAHLIQPIPNSNQVNIILPGLGLSMLLEVGASFPSNFGVATIKGGAFLTGGRAEETQAQMTQSLMISLDSDVYTLSVETLADSLYAHSHCSLEVFGNYIFSVGGDDTCRRASCYNTISDSWK